jgi:YD repeat-containing protein
VDQTFYTNNLSTSAPQRETAPTYDADGNMTTNGVWCYAWDGDNRLIRADDGSNVIVYAYDFMSRRISRTAYRRIAENAFETLDSRTFLYDGWNILSEVVGGPGSTPAATNLYTWGLDLSGTLQGAGGIGGLVAANLNGTNVFYSFDGNGNVTDLTDTNGTLAAHYEYDPFGAPSFQLGRWPTPIRSGFQPSTGMT